MCISCVHIQKSIRIVNIFYITPYECQVGKVCFVGYKNFCPGQAKPRIFSNYAEPGVFDLTAAYARGILRNHPFIDGNKRTEFFTAYGFLVLHGGSS